MKEFLVVYVRTGKNQEQERVSSYNQSTAQGIIKERYGFSNVTIKSCKEV